MNSNLLLTVGAILIVSTIVSANRQCYDNNLNKVTCNSDVHYCAKITLAGIVTRSCDTLNYCPKQGDKCANQGSTIGEVCCCDSDNCNAATVMTKSFLLGLATLALGLTTFFLRL